MQYRKLTEIKKFDNNPRYIKKDDMEKLVTSIKNNPDYFEARPIILSNRTGELIIIAGNQRYEAAKIIGLTEVPTYLLKDLSEEREKEIMIRDNVSNGEWDWELLSSEFEKEELEEWGMDIDKWKEDEVVEDEVPEVTENPVSKLGEVYQLGRHRIMCGDSTKIEDVEKLMDGKKADMVFTDPPYGVDYDGGVIHGNKINTNHKRDKLDNDDIDIYGEFISILKSFVNGAVYIFYATRYSHEIFKALRDNKIDVMAVIAWIKTNTGYADMNSHYKNRYEPFVYCKIGDSTNFIGDTSENTTWEIDKDRNNELHPTQKPISLATRAINNHKAGIVLDLFLGSGSTLIACEQTNRTCYGCEIDPKYCDVIRKRYAKFIGKENEWLEVTPVII